jgi:hypothetical protein
VLELDILTTPEEVTVEPLFVKLVAFNVQELPFQYGIT